MLSFFSAPCLNLDSPAHGQHPEMAHRSVSFPASSQGEVFGIYLKATEYYFLSRCCINSKHNQGSTAWNYDKGLSKSCRKETCVLIIQRYLPSATQTYSFLSLSRNGVAGSERSHTATAMSSSCHLSPSVSSFIFSLYFLFLFPFLLPAPSSSPSHPLTFSTSLPHSISYFGSYPSPLLLTTVSPSFHAPFHIHFHFQAKFAGQKSTCSCQRQESALQFSTDFLQLFGVWKTE